MTTTTATRHTHGAAAAQRAAAVRVQDDIVRRELDAFEQGLQRQTGAQGSGRALTSGSLENENNELPLSSSQQRTMSSSRDRAGRRGTQLTEKKAADTTTTTTMMRSAVLQSLSRTPAFDPHEQHSLLHESLRLQEAARWLLQCPPRTLHVLQQRVLCAAQDHVMTFAGVPSYLKPYVALLNAHAALAQSTGATGKSNESRNTGGMQTWRPPVNGDGERRREEEEEDDEAAALPVPPPAPLPFFTFLADFILGDEDEASDGSAKKEERAGRGNVVKSRSVLCTGRPQPVATLSSANLIYGLPTIERVLSGAQPSSATPEAGKDTSRSSSNNNNNTTNKTASQKRKAATATHNSTINTSQDGQGGNAVYVWMEQHQDIMADLVQWGEFFSSFFDEAREGFCREPVSLMCAVLLACGLLAHCELDESLAAQTRRTLRALREADTGPVTHCHTCEACRARQAAIEAAACERVRQTTYKKSMKTGAAQLRGATAPSTLSSLSQLLAASSPRLFHGTAAVVLWIETFLVLYRNARGGANTTTATAGGGGNAGPRQEEHVEDAMRAAEVYLVRDWIAQQAALDALGFEAQAFDGELRLPLSCASDAPLRRLGFTSCGVAQAVAAITAWADACVTTGRPLATSVLLGLLREHLPVTAYYMTYFLPLHVPYCE